MTPTLLPWFRVAILLLMAYTVFTFVRGCLRRGYWIPRNRKEFFALAGDLLSIAAGLFIWVTVQNNYQRPMEKVLSTREKDFPELVFTEAGSGKTKKLSEYRGQTVLLNLWATWCPPCRAEMPALSQLQDEFRNKGLTVLAISDEDQATVNEYLQNRNYSFVSGTYPGDHPVTKGVNTRPVSILINARGQVTDIVVGARGHGFFRDWVEGEIRSTK
jgi:cytochrome c biogenesis protein CcmG, thiol:disulfide interchange protein DsbE